MLTVAVALAVQLLLFHSRQLLPTSSLQRLVVIGNYLIDSVKCDVFRYCDGQLYEGYLASSSHPTAAPSATTAECSESPNGDCDDDGGGEVDAANPDAHSDASSDDDGGSESDIEWRRLPGATSTRYAGEYSFLNAYLDDMRARFDAVGGVCRTLLLHSRFLRYMDYLRTTYLDTGKSAGSLDASAPCMLVLISDKGARMHEIIADVNEEEEPCVCGRPWVCAVCPDTCLPPCRAGTLPSTAPSLLPSTLTAWSGTSNGSWVGLRMYRLLSVYSAPSRPWHFLWLHHKTTPPWLAA